MKQVERKPPAPPSCFLFVGVCNGQRVRQIAHMESVVQHSLEGAATAAAEDEVVVAAAARGGLAVAAAPAIDGPPAALAASPPTTLPAGPSGAAGALPVDMRRIEGESMGLWRRANGNTWPSERAGLGREAGGARGSAAFSRVVSVGDTCSRV